MTTFRCRIAASVLLVPLVAAAPASFATRRDIERMMATDGGKPLNAYVKRYAMQRETLISDLERAGFSHERRKNGCDYLYGGVAGRRFNGSWNAFVWICSDTAGARSHYAPNI
jgi:hypothetical protein